MSERNTLSNTKKLTILGLLAAISIVMVYLIHFPIFPSAAFLEYDPADITIFIGTLMMGPTAGLLLTVVVAVIQGLTVSAAGGWIGIAMHIIATGSFVVVFGLITRKTKTTARVITGLAVGILTWIIIMFFWNLLLTPIFMGVPREAVLQLMLPAILPFNLIKATVNSVLAFLIYQSVKRFWKADFVY